MKRFGNIFSIEIQMYSFHQFKKIFGSFEHFFLPSSMCPLLNANFVD